MMLSLLTIRDDNEGMNNALEGEILAYVSFFGLLYFKGYVFYTVIKKREQLLNVPEFQ